jgi:thiamine-monophosphate kinase
LGASSSHTSKRSLRRAAPPLDERRFHGWISLRIRNTVGPLPIGDDVAALPIGRGRVALLTSDALVEGYHFLRGSPPHAIGAASASVNLSDIAAKGGQPVAFLLDVLVPPGTPEAWARAVVEGAERQLARFGAHIVGGDTKPSPRATIVGTLVGFASVSRLPPRSGASPGDRLVTTGRVGGGGLAYLRWRRRPSSSTARAGLLRIRPRVREGEVLARWAHAMMDTSDGIADSARLLAEASGLRIVVEEDRLPIAAGLRHAAASRTALRAHLFRGGDYELLATLPSAAVAPARAALRRLGCPLTEIGRVERGRGAWLDNAAGTDPMPEGTWRPFQKGPPGRGA